MDKFDCFFCGEREMVRVADQNRFPEMLRDTMWIKYSLVLECLSCGRWGFVSKGDIVEMPPGLPPIKGEKDNDESVDDR